ncbi:MAG: hypothetical protein LBT95_08345 [Treponema sp.]|jgi:hypothetical protein|nr:hypothetical protein [Treponema sp.]
MKFRIPFIYIIIPVAVAVILLAFGLWMNSSYFLQPFVNWMAKFNVKSFEAYLYGMVVLVLLIPGTLMGVAIIIISKHEDKLLKEKHAIEKTNSNKNYEIDEILHSMEVSLARIKDSSEKIKVQTERIVEISKRLSADSSVGFLPAEEQKPAEEDLPIFDIPKENFPFLGRIAPDKLIGSTDIYAPNRRESLSPEGGLEDYHLSLIAENPGFKNLWEKITILLHQTLKK